MIRVVDSCIKDHSGEYKQQALRENLPRRMMHRRLKTRIEHLDESGKIAADARERSAGFTSLKW